MAGSYHCCNPGVLRRPSFTYWPLTPQSGVMQSGAPRWFNRLAEQLSPLLPTRTPNPAWIRQTPPGRRWAPGPLLIPGVGTPGPRHSSPGGSLPSFSG